jgi:hypothetical protein
MIIAYIAHPIAPHEGVTTRDNLIAIKDIVRQVNLKYPDVIPFVPYYADCIALDENIISERERGLRNDEEFFRRRVMDQLWVYGPRVSIGMQHEIITAVKFNIPVFCMNPDIVHEVKTFL